MRTKTGGIAQERANSAIIAERFRQPIYRYIARLVHDRDRADDLTQETFLRVHQRLDSLKDPAALEAWLYRIATNLSYNHFRQREHRRPTLPLREESDETTTTAGDEAALRPDQLLEQSEMSDCVMKFLTRLPETQRTVIVLHDLQQFSAPEIAEQLGISLDNVKIRLHRARVRLKAALTQGCEFTRDDRGVFVCEPKHPS